MVACCSKARARAKRVATKKANARATRLAKQGKKITPKKTKGKKAKAKKVAPCKICGSRGTP